MITVKNSSNFLSIAASLICVGSIISFVKGGDNIKPLALNLIASSASVAIGSKLSENFCESALQSRKNTLTEQYENQMKILKTENKNWNEKFSKLSNQVDGKDKSICDLQKELDTHRTAITAYQNQVTDLQREFAAKHKILDEKLRTDDKRCEVMIYELKKAFQEDLKYRVQISFEQQSERVALHLSNRQFLNIHPALIKYDELIKNNYLKHCKLLSTIALLSGDSNQIIASICEIYEQISNDVSNAKVRYRNILNLDERTALQGAMEELVERRDSKKFVPMPKVKVALDNYENLQKDELNKIATTASEKFNEIEDLKSQVTSLIDEIDSRNLKIAELQQAVVELNKPIQWKYAITSQGLAGNRIIQFFANKGIILDRSHYLGDLFKTEIYFHVDRNKAGTVLAKDLNEFSEYLGQMCECLEPIKFEWDADNHLMLATAVFSRKVKEKSDISVINKLWIPTSKFESTVKGWSRVRITGGSESGKSPTAENLAVCILKSRPGTAKLYNPQHDSVKNYWTIPVVGASHKDSEKGIAELAKRVDARSNGQEPRDNFELCIFDEIDSTMSHTKGKKSEIGGNVNFIIKQASHQNLGAIFIGQNANVSEYPGMDRSDWNSAVNVHIGSNAYDALTNTNLLTTEETTRLKAIADKLSEFCSAKNEELQLDKTAPNSYRFALVVEPNKKPYFIELPSFGQYQYDLIASSISGKDCAAAQPQTQTAHQHPQQHNGLEALKNRNYSAAALHLQSGYVGASCNSCNSCNVKKAGKYKGKQRYQCNDCNKWFTTEI